nr:DoxX family protein [Halomarina rubra]
MDAFEAVRTRSRRLATRAPPTATLTRAALGAMILLAGVHKLLAPWVWAVYVVDWLAPWLVLTPVEFMLVNGVLEVGFGLALLADRYVAFASLVAAVSLTPPSRISRSSGCCRGGSATFWRGTSGWLAWRGRYWWRRCVSREERVRRC